MTLKLRKLRWNTQYAIEARNGGEQERREVDLDVPGRPLNQSGGASTYVSIFRRPLSLSNRGVRPPLPQNTDNHIHTSNRIFTVGLQTLLMHSFGCVTEHSCRCSKLRTLRQRYYVHKRSWRRKYISPKLRPAGLPQNKLHCVRSRHTTGSLDAADKNSHVLAIRHQFHSLWPNALFTHHLFVLQLPSCSLCEFGTEPT